MIEMVDTCSAEREVLDEIFQRGSPLVPVDAPPGAGKTYLVENIVALAVERFGMRVAVAAPRKNQASDFARRVRSAFPQIAPQLLISSRDNIDPDLTAIGVQSVQKARDLAHGRGVVVSTVDKLSTSFEVLSDERFDLVVFDEAYQTHVANGLPLLGLTDRIVLVGDPGQLEPFTEFETIRFDAAEDPVHYPLPKFLLGKNPAVTPMRLQVTRRLPPDTVPFVQKSFYSNMPFRATATTGERRVEFDAVGMGDAIDAALDRIADGASIVMLMLPAVGREMLVDDHLSATAVAITERFAQRQGHWGALPLDASQFMYVDAHRVSVSHAHLQFLASKYGTPAKIGTPEVVQGLESPLVIARHPLSGLPEVNSFHLAPGRLCVMLTRHKLGCILLGRADIPQALERYEHDCGARLAGLEDDVWRGFVANRRLYAMLREQDRIVYV